MDVRTYTELNTELKALIERKQLLNPELSAALGRPVALLEHAGVLGIIVEVTASGSLWVARPSDTPGDCALYQPNELRIADALDLAGFARGILQQQYYGHNHAVSAAKAARS